MPTGNNSARPVLDHPALSLITVTLNAGKTVGETIRSVLEQTFTGFEYVIVDGGSTDDTMAIIRQYGDCLHNCLSEPDRGVYDAMNKGVALARGDWVFFLGADDRLYHRDTLKNIFCGNDVSPWSLLYGSVVEGDPSSAGKSWRFVPRYDSSLLWKNTIHHQGVFYRRELFRDFRYDVTCKVSADYELNLKSYLSRVPALKLDDIVSVCASGGLSGRADFAGYREEIRLRHRHVRRRWGLLMDIQTCLRFCIKKVVAEAKRVTRRQSAVARHQCGSERGTSSPHPR